MGPSQYQAKTSGSGMSAVTIFRQHAGGNGGGSDTEKFATVG